MEEPSFGTADLILGQILGWEEGLKFLSPANPRDVWRLCQEERHPLWGRTGHWHPTGVLP